MQDVKQDRWKYIGGSDIPIIMGLVNYGKSRWDLLREKAQLWEDEFEGNEYTEYGNEMEDVIRSYVNFRFDTKFEEHKRIIEPFYRYHADGYDADKHLLLEVKTTGDTPEDLITVPQAYKKFLVQLLFGMEMYEANGLLAVYQRPADMSTEFFPSRLVVYPVDRHDYKDVLDEIANALSDFFEDLDFLKDNPECEEKDLPSRNALVPLANQLIELESSIALLKKMEDEYKELRARLKGVMEERGIKSWTLNNTTFSLIADEEDKIVEVFNEKEFARTHPDMYEEFKIWRPKKGRAGYVRVTQKKGAVNE